jgi:hypothetical protein
MAVEWYMPKDRAKTNTDQEIGGLRDKDLKPDS